MTDESFKAFVLDQLSALPELRARAMFGGHGLYQGRQFFGILFDGRLYFKTNARSRAAYVARGMPPFTFESGGRVTTMQYHEVPPEILDDSPALVAWARRAVETAAASRRARATSRSRRIPRGSGR